MTVQSLTLPPVAGPVRSLRLPQWPVQSALWRQPSREGCPGGSLWRFICHKLCVISWCVTSSGTVVVTPTVVSQALSQLSVTAVCHSCLSQLSVTAVCHCHGCLSQIASHIFLSQTGCGLVAGAGCNPNLFERGKCDKGCSIDTNYIYKFRC